MVHLQQIFMVRGRETQLVGFIREPDSFAVIENHGRRFSGILPLNVIGPATNIEHLAQIALVTIGQHVIFYVNMLPYLHESISGRNKFSRLKAFLTEAGYENQVRRSFGDDGRAEFKHSVETANPCATIEGFLTKYREYLENGPN